MCSSSAGTPNAEVAADLTAEVFAAALVGAASFSERQRPAVPWLFTIAKNKLTDSYRRSQVEDDARRELGTPPLQLTDDLLEHLEYLNTSTVGQDALHRLEKLPADQRDAIQSHVLDDRSYLEIVTELGTSPSVVRQRVSRGLSSLRNQIRRARPLTSRSSTETSSRPRTAAPNRPPALWLNRTVRRPVTLISAGVASARIAPA